MNYYEHHLGDFMRDTAHLSMLEEAAYRRLLDAYYIRERALPLDARECCKLARAVSKPERDAVAYVLREFFTHAEDGYHQSRADREIARFQDKQRKAKASADARWSQSGRNANASADAMRTHSEGNADGMHRAPVPRHQTPDTKEYPARTSADEGVSARAAPTHAGAVCLALRRAGLTAVNPSHPDLLALLEAGATEDELVAIVPSAMGKGDPFAWLLVAARNRRRDAKAAAAQMHAGPLPPSPPPQDPAWRAEQRAATAAFAGRYAAKAIPSTQPPAVPAGEVIDATAPRLVG